MADDPSSDGAPAREAHVTHATPSPRPPSPQPLPSPPNSNNTTGRGWGVSFPSFPGLSFPRPFGSSPIPAPAAPAPPPTTTPATTAAAANSPLQPGLQEQAALPIPSDHHTEVHTPSAPAQAPQQQEQKQEQDEHEHELEHEHDEGQTTPSRDGVPVQDSSPGVPRRLGEWLWAGMRGYGPGGLVGGVGAGVGMVVGLPLNLAGRFNPFALYAARSTHPLPVGDQGDGEEAALIASYAHDFNERLHRPDAQPLLDQISAFVSGHDAGVGLEEQGRALHAFVDTMEAQMAAHPLWAHLPADSGRALLVECLERHLTHTLHARLFLCGPSAARQDEDLFQRVTSLQFIGPRHLGLPAELAHVSLETAQEALFTMNSKRSPYEKTCCLLRCARTLLRLLAEATRRRTDEIGADDFLPGLIYLLIKTNPPLLHSNLRYISCFRHPARAAGEGAYYFVHFVSAVSFIENLNPSLLNMDPADFELGLKDPEAFAKKEREREKEEEEARRREEEEKEEAARRRSDSDVDEGEGEASWVYLKKTGQAVTVDQATLAQQALTHHVGTQTELSPSAEDVHAPPASLDPSAEDGGDRFLRAEAEELDVADVAELLRLYRQLRAGVP